MVIVELPLPGQAAAPVTLCPDEGTAFAVDAFTTIRHARALTERHPKHDPKVPNPDAPTPSVCQVALLLATYADGRFGTSIFPGNTRIIEQTGLARSTVRRALKWLLDHGEIRKDRESRGRGSAACYSYLLPDRKGEHDEPLSQKGAHSEQKGAHDEPPLAIPTTREIETWKLELENQVRPGQPEGASSKTKRMYKLDADGKTTAEYEDVDW